MEDKAFRPLLYKLFPLESKPLQVVSTCNGNQHVIQYAGFCELYSITLNRQNGGSQSGSDRDKYRTRGLKSPWGTRAAICSQFHWTYEYLLWGISWFTVQMFLADMPSYESNTDASGDTVTQIESKDQLANYVKSLM